MDRGDGFKGRQFTAEVILWAVAKIGSKAYLTTQQLWDESGRHVKLG
jgi:hypothetical protein